MTLTHCVIIPDGNRRWARAQGLMPWEGHRKSVERFRELIPRAFERGISYLTIWVASEDNLTGRSREEVAVLVELITDELERMNIDDSLIKNETRVRIIGRWDDILRNEKLRGSVVKIEGKTRHFSKRNFTILFGYDGVNEMLEAINKLKSSKREITNEILKNILWTGELPNVDLVIRTGGEPHWSAGFMMWHTANSQFYFTETLCPDFGVDEFDKALEDYSSRERRFGK
ncbi:di-trans,poly-cis-decaprenylcistransferase [Candidatus Wolfebacteria bacterium RIFCSPLOWO2_01_FULL_45_19]|uniref:Isoprenyl transferase n=1 Tax=Candidatus Wolfebacteria bacterium RIFCSPLOWO2_01_FULL_45_19 TaxID=1802557 RepID=A0A1F8DUZ3_9BACT|nr:MAG: Isoprenyl transferase [Parcubacteria group bacterium GW2011_GWB1_45_9]OGM91648.1 MAG: di-trans,poly-cis-decaprenylcistransferase [Candidatus Wolfebacteria bacterium RIFCSPLOWO2_01_FULL_45_19]